MLNVRLKYAFNMKAKADIHAQMMQKLLDAAGEVFAERGFARATVREICERAGANIAAVNYYFHDKENLYREAIKYWSDISQEKYPTDLGLGPNSTAEEKLHAFIRSFLFRILDKNRPGWHGQLMTREMVEPTGALDDLIETAYRPLYDRLGQIVRELGGGRLDEFEVRLCSRSIWLRVCIITTRGRQSASWTPKTSLMHRTLNGWRGTSRAFRSAHSEHWRSRPATR